MALTTPFDYRNILIGEEIIYRSLIQQEDHHQKGWYGAQWTDRDGVEKSGAYFRANVLRTDFSIPAEFQHCIPYPPCPWEKQDHKVTIDEFKPVIMGADGVYTHAFDVHLRTDSGTASFTVGSKIISYSLDQNALNENVRGEFSYYQNTVINQNATGKAVVVIKRFHRGNADHEFYYLFDL